MAVPSTAPLDPRGWRPPATPVAGGSGTLVAMKLLPLLWLAASCGGGKPTTTVPPTVLPEDPVAAGKCSELPGNVIATGTVESIEDNVAVAAIRLAPKVSLPLSYSKDQMVMGTGAASFQISTVDGKPKALIIDGPRIELRIKKTGDATEGQFALESYCDAPLMFTIGVTWPATPKVGDALTLKLDSAPR